MKTALATLLALFSFSAVFAADSSAVEKVKNLKPQREFCKASQDTVAGWTSKLTASQLDQASKIVAELSKSPTSEDLKTIRAAIKEDPADVLQPYWGLMGCALLKSRLAEKLTSLASARGTPENQKSKAKTTLKELLTKGYYETFIDAMVNVSILEKMNREKLVSLDANDAAKLKEAKLHVKDEAKSWQEKVNTKFPEAADAAKFNASVLKANPNYEKNKALWSEENEHAGHALAVVQSLATKIK